MNTSLLTNDHCEETYTKLADRQKTYAYYYDRAKSDTTAEYVSGQNVVYRNGYDDKNWRRGVIVEKHPDSNRSYNILNEKGNVIRRNIRFILPDNTTRKFTIIPPVLPKIQVPPTPKTPTVLVPSKPDIDAAKTPASNMAVPVKHEAIPLRHSARLAKMNLPEPRRSSRLKEKAVKVQN